MRYIQAALAATGQYFLILISSFLFDYGPPSLDECTGRNKKEKLPHDLQKSVCSFLSISTWIVVSWLEHQPPTHERTERHSVEQHHKMKELWARKQFESYSWLSFHLLSTCPFQSDRYVGEDEDEDDLAAFL